MPLVRYFLFVGTALLALLFIVDACLPQSPVVESANTAANANTATDSFGDPDSFRSEVAGARRIRHQPAGPDSCAGQDGGSERSRQRPMLTRRCVCGMLSHSCKPDSCKPDSRPKKLEPPLKRAPVVSKTVVNRTVASRSVSKSHAGPPVILIAQQPRPGFFPNTIW